MKNRNERQEGFAIIFSVIMLLTMTGMGLIAADIATMEIGLGSAQHCEDLARQRANSCTQLYLQAVASAVLPSYKLKELDKDEIYLEGIVSGHENVNWENTVECLVPALTVEEGAAKEGDGAIAVGKLFAPNYSTDYTFRIVFVKTYGFAGPGCGQLVFDATNDPFNVLQGAEVAVGSFQMHEAAISYGPCKSDNPC